MTIIKKLELAVALAIIFLAASCKKEKDLNRLPSVPVLLSPQNGAVAGSDNITLRWQASQDAEGDDIRYEVVISKDSVDWNTIGVFNKTSVTLSSINGNNVIQFIFEEGGKYYWRVKAINSFSGNIPEQENGESVSEVFQFYTAPPGVNALSVTSGNKFINLKWSDPENVDHIEITFTPQVSSIAQPVIVNAGVGKVDLSGFENETIYSFLVKVYDNLNHISVPDTIKDMPLSPTLVRDVDYNIYSTVQIGPQTWMRENLRTTRWQNGKEMKSSSGFKYYRIGSTSNTYGYYYLVDAAVNGSQAVNPCPCGYHVPTDDDWKALERYLGMTEADINSIAFHYFRGENEGVGSLLKSATGWDVYNGVNGNGSDLYGFKLLPAGSIDIQSGSNALNTGISAMVWSKSHGDGTGIARSFASSYKGIYRYQSGGPFALSIRCLKD